MWSMRNCWSKWRAQVVTQFNWEWNPPMSKFWTPLTNKFVPNGSKRCSLFAVNLKIRTLAHFIIGLPGETEESARQTIEFSKEIDPRFRIVQHRHAESRNASSRSKRLREGWTDIQMDTLDNSTAFPGDEYRFAFVAESMGITKSGDSGISFAPKLFEYERRLAFGQYGSYIPVDSECVCLASFDI